MPFLRSILDSLFGAGDNRRSNQGDDPRMFGDRFRNPIWQNDHEDDDEEYGDNRHNHHARPNFHFEIFTNPLEMTRYFESQIDSMMKDFFHFGTNEDHQAFGNFREIMPPNSQKGDLRDEVLKPGYALPPPNYGVDCPKCDEDLDGKVDPKELGRVWNDEAAHMKVPRERKVPHNFTFRSFGRSFVSQTTRLPDGSIEERKTTTDNEGNSETVVTHRIGDKTHTTVTKTDKYGVETVTEKFDNMDPGELSDFNKTWKPDDPKPAVEPGALTKFPWSKFFDFTKDL